ncbi:type II toxin-antitoxin system RelE/ParE family toxin [Gordonia polyisoprenivorans]|uniref:type II toxin-antitoxin system RelE/ParE family toxin n=1 Tax=Gordonia polyisoprenivorans TaxID=84595 RepID=UPI00230055B4|nr:type II toxin-antitoxin system RelE/ParE family toxin [Gordonia polyisoprenivorans]WCB38850.1 type II toxin-antitoxin system RelE/ParE family toxin [Gordonia polyisoprenivorans]
MIQSFATKDTERVWARKFVPRLGPELTRVAHRKLQALDAAQRLADLASPPGNRLEPLSGDRAEQHSIRVNDQYRLCFTWTPVGPVDMEIVDYH